MHSKSLKTLAICALIIAVGGLTLGYAALTQSLNVDTTTTVQNSKKSWMIRFQNASSASVTGSATEGTLELTDTTVTLSGVTLKAPGDSVSYTFDVTNSGEVGAKISSITNSGPTITASSSSDETLVSDNYVYTLTYKGGTAITTSDTLDSGETKTLQLTVSLKSSMDTLPGGDVKVDAQKTVITYVQQ